MSLMTLKKQRSREEIFSAASFDTARTPYFSGRSRITVSPINPS